MSREASHGAQVQREFTRQAESFAASKTLGAGQLTEAIARGLRDSVRGRVLDLAAGPGLVASVLAAEAREVVALDLTAETLRVARARLHGEGRENVRFVRADGLALPFREADFDAAVIRLALHHLEAPGGAVRAAHGALRADGRLAVLDLVAPEDPEDEPLLTALERLRDPSHVRALRDSELAELVASAGFELERHESFLLERRFSEWAAIIADPVRMDALFVVMRELARRGVGAGAALREAGDELVFDYRFTLVVGRKR